MGRNDSGRDAVEIFAENEMMRYALHVVLDQLNKSTDWRLARKLLHNSLTYGIEYRILVIYSYTYYCNAYRTKSWVVPKAIC